MEHLSRLRTRHQAEHYHSAQDVERVRLAFAAVEDGLVTLSNLGHPYHLEPGVSPEIPEWPKVLFHVDAAPNGRVVASLLEAEELGPGWFDTLAGAQHFDGVRTQFAGRGGIGDRSVPMLVGTFPGVQPEVAHQPSDNRAVIEAWKRGNGHGV